MNDFFATIGSKLASKIHHDEAYTNPNEHIYQVTPTVDRITVSKESFSKVFDKTVELVNHAALMMSLLLTFSFTKMLQFMVSLVCSKKVWKQDLFQVIGEILEYLESYLSGRKQTTVVNGVNSQLQNICYGVPQGSILGPDCFSVNNMPSKVSNNDGVDLFADDCNAFEIGDSVDEALSMIQSTATNVHNYSNKNSLTIHPEKCHLMILTRDKFIGPLKEIKLDNKPITVVNDCKCLGVTIDKDLNCVSHISNVCKAFSAKVKKLYNIRSMSQGTLKTIYFQRILPSALYGIIIWGSSSNLNVLNDIHIR